MHGDSNPFRFTDLEGRLGEADRDLLSAVIFADEVLEEEKAHEQAGACLRTLQAEDPKSEVAALRARIKAAEREGKLEEAIRLAEELDRRSRARSSTEV
jgi:thioredoxin-like negative regulator of GroEL